MIEGGNIEGLRQEIAAWAEKWEAEEWTKEEPEKPTSSEMQAKVDAFYPRIIATVEGRDPAFADDVTDEASRQRFVGNWGGIGALLALYEGTAGEDRTAIIGAMGKAIDHTDQHTNASLDVLHMVTSLQITELEGNIKRLEKTPLGKSHEMVRNQIGTYKSHRIMDTFFSRGQA